MKDRKKQHTERKQWRKKAIQKDRKEEWEKYRNKENA